MGAGKYTYAEATWTQSLPGIYFDHSPRCVYNITDLGVQMIQQLQWYRPWE